MGSRGAVGPFHPGPHLTSKAQGRMDDQANDPVETDEPETSSRPKLPSVADWLRWVVVGIRGQDSRGDPVCVRHLLCLLSQRRTDLAAVSSSIGPPRSFASNCFLNLLPRQGANHAGEFLFFPLDSSPSARRLEFRECFAGGWEGGTA